MKGFQQLKNKKKKHREIKRAADIMLRVKGESQHRVKEVQATGLIESFKKYQSDLVLLLIPVILFLIYLLLANANNNALSKIKQNSLSSENFYTTIHVYPFVQAVQMPQLSAKAAIVTDADSQVVIFSKDPRSRFSMASTTKIMTALTAMEYFKKDAILTVQKGSEGSQLGLVPGEQYYFHDLLYAMLLPSANDAAQTIADNYPSGSEGFIRRMNDKAAELHLADTHFSDPTGLDDDGDYTNVMDMARLASFAIKNKEFTAITSTKEKFISNIHSTREFDLHNLNKLLGVDGVYGIKTGTTEGAGEVLVTSTVQNGHTFIIVVMNSHQRFVDTQTLLDFIANNIQYISPSFPSSGLSGQLRN
jgi:serine-type D-Ala-D-Ala carboxypeptidase (penicillin-binding protein 5/6)